ncbi:hypothetical protein Pan44_32180 [Caulifigura coniformis]|uniref:Carboxypeptidase regulatory-like domain-containing protein n=2 Tax=Caulifigura coniformis TaxID=2527983 RepID=A0A517SGB6_9PLAN|nr:hypothetical protein Pan44_32180 [Caulifigura coniformis]
MVTGSLLLLLITGCGGSERPALVEVTGTVTLDGRPLEGAQVVLKPIKVDDPKFQRPARATTDAQGKFTPNAYGDAKGLPPGTYGVGVSKREVVGKLPDNFNTENPALTPANFRLLVPKPYESPDTSNLEIEIAPGGITPDPIALETGGAKPQVESTGKKRSANEP